MPHVIVKMYAGRANTEKTKLAEEIAKAVTAVLNLRDEAVSVSVEDFAPADWAEKVYKPDILDQPNTLYKKPGYNPFG